VSDEETVDYIIYTNHDIYDCNSVVISNSFYLNMIIIISFITTLLLLKDSLH